MTTIHPDLLRTLVTIADAGSFTAAARALGLRQSTISQHVRRLEEATSRRLLDRDTHRIAFTAQGEAMLDQARRVLEAHDGMARFLSGVPLRGRLRFGASEDFVLSALPDVLAAFIRRYPGVDLELSAGLSEDIYAAFDAGRLDIIFVKRRAGDRRGITAWREPIAWVGQPGLRLDLHAPLPLLLYPPPSVTRASALETLERAGRPWRIAFTSGSLNALGAAARAGIGLMPHSMRLIPPGLAVAMQAADLPALAELEFVIIGPGGHHMVADTLTQVILQWAASGRTNA
ncbi:LysR family transcriptional regulator [Flavisphingomonas formosensis]|uniref:LysR family transcriptional regulator n=1 Tax=Flavisphingomonas formosensis TaxID=861534 RepID=UPI001E437DE1|nr:LysR substrate-binding domain-containing protein [Sphingomonas formosensis]